MFALSQLAFSIVHTLKLTLRISPDVLSAHQSISLALTTHNAADVQPLVLIVYAAVHSTNLMSSVNPVTTATLCILARVSLSFNAAITNALFASTHLSAVIAKKGITSIKPLNHAFPARL